MDVRIESGYAGYREVAEHDTPEAAAACLLAWLKQGLVGEIRFRVTEQREHKT